MRKITTIIIATLIMTGCATQTFQIDSSASSSASTPTKEVRQTFFISGLGQTQELNAATVCGGADKISKVEAQSTLVDNLLGILTAGIYTPRTARVYCVK